MLHQGWKLCRSRDNARSITHCTTVGTSMSRFFRTMFLRFIYIVLSSLFLFLTTTSLRVELLGHMEDVCLLFFLFWPPHGINNFPTQGSDLSFNCHLLRSCNNARSFNPLHQARDRTSVLVQPRCHRSHCLIARTSRKAFTYLSFPQDTTVKRYYSPNETLSSLQHYNVCVLVTLIDF